MLEKISILIVEDDDWSNKNAVTAIQGMRIDTVAKYEVTPDLLRRIKKREFAAVLSDLNVPTWDIDIPDPADPESEEPLFDAPYLQGGEIVAKKCLEYHIPCVIVTTSFDREAKKGYVDVIELLEDLSLNYLLKIEVEDKTVEVWQKAFQILRPRLE